MQPLREKCEYRKMRTRNNSVFGHFSHSEIPSKMMKNVFYFILKAFFVSKIFKFLSWLFGHAEKTAWLERLISKFMTAKPG